MHVASLGNVLQRVDEEIVQRPSELMRVKDGAVDLAGERQTHVTVRGRFLKCLSMSFEPVSDGDRLRF